VYDPGGDRVGRFGWKADIATLRQFVGEAFRNELGITNPFAPIDLVTRQGCGGTESAAPEDDGTLVEDVTAYLASLPPTPAREVHRDGTGKDLFAAAGCGACHTPTLTSAAGVALPLYSDLLLHDMGPALADNVVQASAQGADWRTTPLWGLAARPRLLHDGRTTNMREAILAHGGEGAAAAEIFLRFSRNDQEALLQFLSSL
jgi:CxxC motif-containing protein (DUF1111 family)